MRAPILTVICFIFIFEPINSHPQFLNLPEFPPPVDLKNKNNAAKSDSSKTNMKNLEATVKEVEAILKSNPALPRLTRGEILDLLENITLSESRDKKKSDGRNPKAVMVVLPFTPDNESDKNMAEFFTKPPLTQIVGGQPTTKKSEILLNDENLINSVKKTDDFQGEPQPFRRRPTSTTTTVQPPQEVSTQKRNHQRRRRPTSTTTDFPITTFSYKRRPTRRKITSTTVRYSNHRYPEEASTIQIPKVSLPEIVNPNVINDHLMLSENQRKEMVVENDEKFVDKNELDVIQNDLKDESTKEPLKQVIPTIKPPTNDEESRIKELLTALADLQEKSITTTTTVIPDISNVADNLSPEMKDLLMNFGLIPNSKETIVENNSGGNIESYYNAEKPEIKPESYVGFKPLPDDDDSQSEIEDLLARFGLGRNAKQEKVKNKIETNDEFNVDAVPGAYTDILEDIGFKDREGKTIRAQPFSKQHVFNPHQTKNVSNDEIKKLNRLLNVFKQLEKLNGTITEENTKDINQSDLQEIITSLNEANRLVPLNKQSAPNPIEYDNSISKNEIIKRQETSAATTTTTTTTTTELSTNVTEIVSEGPSIKDLEESFGGTTEALKESTPETTTQGLRRTGFYYLIDWNTFLDIDDQKGKRVNLRFQPTIGDPKRFYSVNVP